jgi:hypothetical protein
VDQVDDKYWAILKIPALLTDKEKAMEESKCPMDYTIHLDLINQFQSLKDVEQNQSKWFAATLLHTSNATQLLAAATGEMNDVVYKKHLQASMEYVANFSRINTEGERKTGVNTIPLHNVQTSGDCTMLVVNILSSLKNLNHGIITVENGGGIAGCKCYVTAAQVLDFNCIVSDSTDEAFASFMVHENMLTGDKCEQQHSNSIIPYEIYLIDSAKLSSFTKNRRLSK